MRSLSRRLIATCLVLQACISWAAPADDAGAVLQGWSAAYSANDVDAVVDRYWPDAVLLGTVSPVMSEGTGAIRTYFGRLKGSGNKNAIQDNRVFVLDDSAVVLTGFYLFTRMQDGKPVEGPSRFTMLMQKRQGQWKIAHHHSSPLVKAP
jgi:uncharacterized protein (TIGR02246 family)